MTANGCDFFRCAMVSSVLKKTQVVRINYIRTVKNKETQQENTKNNTKQTNEINWD